MRYTTLIRSRYGGRFVTPKTSTEARMVNVYEAIPGLFSRERFFIHNERVLQAIPSAVFPTGLTIGGFILRPPVVLYDTREEAETVLYGNKAANPTA